MPTYAYACTACDHRFEIFQPFSEDSLTACPRCDGRLRKLFNAVGVVFKGGGFYRTDSRTDSRSGSSSSGSSSSTPTTSSAAKSESSSSTSASTSASDGSAA